MARKKKGSLSINSDNIFPIIKKWLYSDHDIFYRELISNGCDAVTKLKKLDMMGEYAQVEAIRAWTYMQLVQNYGKYTKNLREFLEKQKIVLAGEGWAVQDPKSETYKKFMKGLKGTNYWKIYDASTKNPSIPYLDNVMEQVMQQATNGLSNSRRFDEIINMLYSNDY